MILRSPCALELYNIVFRGRCEDIVSLSVEVIHDLSIDTGATQVDRRIETEAVELVLVHDPLLI